MTARTINEAMAVLDSLGTDSIHFYRLDDDGNPVRCTAVEWGLWLDGSREERRVETTHIGGATVSTMFIGIHNLVSKVFLPYETLIMGGTFNGRMSRYDTLKAAKKGHAQWCARLKEKSDDTE